MTSDDKFYLTAWIVAGVIIIAVTIGFTMYNINNANVVKEAILHGADPIEASCAIMNPHVSTCAIRATKGE